MKNTFYFLIQREKKKKYSVQMRAMHIMAAILLLVYAVMLIPAWDEKYMEVVAFIPAGIGIIVLVLWKKNQVEHVEVNRILRILEIGSLGMAGNYFYQSANFLLAGFYFLVALIMLILLFVEHRIFGEHFITITQRKIDVPMLVSTKKIDWSEIKHVVLKHDLLTVEFQDGKFWQQQIFHKYDAGELAQFQDFLNRQLH